MITLVTLSMFAQAAPSLDYQVAAEGCPDAGRFSDEVSARLGLAAFASGDGSTGVLSVRIVALGDELLGTLELAGGSKAVRGATCDRVFDDLVTAAAVALDTQPAPVPAAVVPKAAPPSTARVNIETSQDRVQIAQITGRGTGTGSGSGDASGRCGLTDPKVPSLDDGLQKLLEQERTAALRDDLAEVQARVKDAVRKRVDGDGGPSGGGGSAAAGGGVLWRLIGPVLGLALGVTVGLGVGLPAGWLLRGPVPQPHVDAPVSTPPAPVIAAPAPVPGPTEPVPAPLAPAPAPSDAGSDARRDAGRDVDSEQARIDQARVALRRGRPHDALVTLMGHAREFPEGRLVEERERLMIEALVAEGRAELAKERLVAFEARWPYSIHLPMLLDLLSDQ